MPSSTGARRGMALRLVAALLATAVTGSLASSFHGGPLCGMDLALMTASRHGAIINSQGTVTVKLLSADPAMHLVTLHDVGGYTGLLMFARDQVTGRHRGFWKFDTGFQGKSCGGTSGRNSTLQHNSAARRTTVEFIWTADADTPHGTMVTLESMVCASLRQWWLVPSVEFAVGHDGAGADPYFVPDTSGWDFFRTDYFLYTLWIGGVSFGLSGLVLRWSLHDQERHQVQRLDRIRTHRKQTIKREKQERKLSRKASVAAAGAEPRSRSNSRSRPPAESAAADPAAAPAAEAELHRSPSTGQQGVSRGLSRGKSRSRSRDRRASVAPSGAESTADLINSSGADLHRTESTSGKSDEWWVRSGNAARAGEGAEQPRGRLARQGSWTQGDERPNGGLARKPSQGRLGRRASQVAEMQEVSAPGAGLSRSASSGPLIPRADAALARSGSARDAQPNAGPGDSWADVLSTELEGRFSTAYADAPAMPHPSPVSGRRKYEEGWWEQRGRR